MNIDFGTEQTRLLLTVTDNRRLEDPWCKNWVTGHLQVNEGSCAFATKLSISLNELADFAQQLQRLHQQLTGGALWKKGCSGFWLQTVIGKRGHLHWTAEYKGSYSDTMRLHFEFNSDQSYLPAILEQIANVLNACPIFSSLPLF